MVANLLVRRIVKMGLKKLTPGVTKPAKERAVKATMKEAVKGYEQKAGKAYLENKPIRDKSMLQMADKIRKDMETLFGKK
jgi:hypothetical protein